MGHHEGASEMRCEVLRQKYDQAHQEYRIIELQKHKVSLMVDKKDHELGHIKAFLDDLVIGVGDAQQEKLPIKEYTERYRGKLTQNLKVLRAKNKIPPCLKDTIPAKNQSLTTKK